MDGVNEAMDKLVKMKNVSINIDEDKGVRLVEYSRGAKNVKIAMRVRGCSPTMDGLAKELGSNYRATL